MGDSTLGTFRVSRDDWDKFKSLCSESGSSASAEIVAFISSCIEAQKVPGSMRIDSSLDSYIDERIDNVLHGAIADLKGEVEAIKKPLATVG